MTTINLLLVSWGKKSGFESHKLGIIKVTFKNNLMGKMILIFSISISDIFRIKSEHVKNDVFPAE